MDDRTLMDTAATSKVERCTCPLCGANVPVATPYVQPPFAVTRCGECGLWYLNPRLPVEDARNLYTRDDYFRGGKVGYAD